jgi:hypothetical protein
MFVTNRSNMSALELTIHPGDLGILGIWGSLSCWVTARITLKMPKLTNMKLATSRCGEKNTMRPSNVMEYRDYYYHIYIHICIYHYYYYYSLPLLLLLFIIFLVIIITIILTIILYLYIYGWEKCETICENHGYPLANSYNLPWKTTDFVHG